MPAFISASEWFSSMKTRILVTLVLTAAVATTVLSVGP